MGKRFFIPLILLFAIGVLFSEDILEKYEDLFENQSSLNIDYSQFTTKKDMLFTPVPGESDLYPTLKKLSIKNAIDENSYMIGCGDEFFISFLNRPSLSYTGTVNIDGDLFIPSLGLIKLGKIPLSEAKIKIKEGFPLKSKGTKASDMYVTLSATKKVTVSITGLVPKPGSYIFEGEARLFDAIKVAIDKYSHLNRYDIRNIRCSSKDTIIYYDILRFLKKGDLSQNPYLYPGDVIEIKEAKRTITIFGAITGPFKGVIPIKKDETISSILSCFDFEDAADSSFIFLKRLDENNQEKIIKVERTLFEGYKLNDKDVLIVPTKKKYPDMMTVFVWGEVERPGYYPIIKNKTTVGEVLKEAVILNSASKKKIAIIRYAKTIELPQNPQLNNVMTNIITQSFSRSEMNNAISLLVTAKDYTVIPVSEESGTILENNDYIIVPRVENVVYISGAVKRAGGYAFEEGKSLSYYLSLAGGYNHFADKNNIFKIVKYGNVLQYSNSKEVNDGDIIVVPYAKENKFFNNIFLPSFQIVATSITLLVAILSVFK
ncbi:MAG: SLBB domain-containing protein [Chitinispirillaceae bacterium]|nr:SLBB domain-containing protein [Chitinispirillaceae bacterium]